MGKYQRDFFIYKTNFSNYQQIKTSGGMLLNLIVLLWNIII